MNKLLRHFAYKDWQELIKACELPALFVDLDQFDANILTLKKIADENNKKIRLATKSLRVPFLIDYVLKSGTASYQGLMCFSVSEAFQLFKMGHKDLLVAYPTHSELDLKLVKEIQSAGGKCVLTFDHIDHLSWAAQVWKKMSSDVLEVCLDLDASLKIFGLHLGVRRSSIVSMSDFSDRLEQLFRFPELKLRGLLHYEAQIAGLPDRDHEFILIQKIKEFIRKYSSKTVRAERERFLNVLNQKSLNIDFFNGGGTGSIDSSSRDPITEVTVGSGLLHSHLFDKYSNCHTFAAEFFVLPITRLPAQKIITCQSGGFIASGEVAKNKSPEIHLPKMLKIISSENFGEVQTPFVSQSLQEFNLGDPVILRPAKSGEIMERFNKVVLVRSGKIVDVVPTYRGLGFNFF